MTLHYSVVSRAACGGGGGKRADYKSPRFYTLPRSTPHNRLSLSPINCAIPVPNRQSKPRHLSDSGNT